MKLIVILSFSAISILCWGGSATLYGQQVQLVAAETAGRETAIVESSTQVLKEIMEIPAKNIPASLLADAQGIAIIPRLIKGGFIVGVRRGHGIAIVRDEHSGWRPPSFVTVTGGSIGWQIGVQSTDLILVFKTQKSVKRLLHGKFTLGADMAAAAGPVGREVAAATDASLNAEIYSYSRSRGLFAGISLDGSAIQIDSVANASYYPFSAAGQVQQIPPSAHNLLSTLLQYTATGSPATPRTANAFQNGPAVDSQTARRQLAESFLRLSATLDDRWKEYLALPAEVFEGEIPPTAEVLNDSLSRFNTVAAEPRYQALSHNPEFQNTHGLLKKYATLQTASRTLNLPPPPR